MLEIAWGLVAAQYSAALSLKALGRHRYACQLLEGVGVGVAFLVFFSSFDALAEWASGMAGVNVNWAAAMQVFKSLQGDVSSLMWAVIYSAAALAGAYAIASLVAGVSFIGIPVAVALNFIVTYVLGAINASARIVSTIYILIMLMMFFAAFACYFAKPMFMLGAVIFPFHFTRRVGVTLMVFSLVTYVGFPIVASQIAAVDGGVAPFFNKMKDEAELVEQLKGNTTRVKLAVTDRVGRPIIFPYIMLDWNTNTSAGRWVNGTEAKTLLLRGSHSVEAWFLGLYHHVNQSTINIDGPSWEPDNESATDWSKAWRNASTITIGLDRIDLANNGTFLVFWDPRLKGSSGNYDINLTLPVTSYSYKFINKTDFNNKTKGNQTWTYYLTHAKWNGSDVIYFAHLNSTKYSFKVSTPSEVKLEATVVQASPEELVSRGYVESYGQLEIESQWVANITIQKLVANPDIEFEKLIIEGSLAKSYNSSSPVKASSRTIVVHASLNAEDESIYVPPASFDPYWKEGLPSWALYNRDSLVRDVNLSTIFWSGLQQIYDILSGFFTKLAITFVGFIAILVGADYTSRTLGGLSLSGKVISFVQNPWSKLGKPLKHVKKKVEEAEEKASKKGLEKERKDLRKREEELLEEERHYEQEMAEAEKLSDAEERNARQAALRTGQYRTTDELEHVKRRIEKINDDLPSMWSRARGRGGRGVGYHVNDVLGATRYNLEGADGAWSSLKHMDRFLNSRAGHEAGRAVIASRTGLSRIVPSLSYVKASQTMMNDYLRSQLGGEIDRSQREIQSLGEHESRNETLGQSEGMKEFTFTYTTRRGVQKSLTIKADDIGTAEYIAGDWLTSRDTLEELGGLT